MSITYEVLNYNKNGKLFLIMILQNPAVLWRSGSWIFIQKEAYMIMSIPYLHGNFKTKMRIRFGYAFSMNLMLLLILKFSKAT